MYSKPQVIFSVKTLDDQINILTEFLKTDEDLNATVANYILTNLGIEKKELIGKTEQERKEVIKNFVTPIYNIKQNQMKKKVEEYQTFWNENERFVCLEFEKIFKIAFKGIRRFNAQVNLNPVNPRYLSEDAFDVFYIKKKEEVLEVCIHELIHFYWFQLFSEYYPEISTEKFESPHVEWLLSEIAVDPIIYFSKLREVCSVRPAYDVFYETKINDESVINFFRKLYKSNNLENFLIKSLKFLNENKQLVEKLVK